MLRPTIEKLSRSIFGDVSMLMYLNIVSVKCLILICLFSITVMAIPENLCDYVGGLIQS